MGLSADGTDQVTHDKFLEYMDHHVKLKERRLVQWHSQEGALDKRQEYESVIDTFVKPVIELWKGQSMFTRESSRFARSTDHEAKETPKPLTNSGPATKRLEELVGDIAAQLIANMNTAIPTPQSSQSSNLEMEGINFSSMSISNSHGSNDDFITTLRQAQNEAEQSGCEGGLLMSQYLVNSFESILTSVNALLPVLQQELPVHGFTSSNIHEHPRTQGFMRTSEPAASTPHSIARAVKNSTSAPPVQSPAPGNLCNSCGGRRPCSHSESSPRPVGPHNAEVSTEGRKHSNDKQIYPFNPDVKLARDIWREWTNGLNGEPSLKSMVESGEFAYYKSTDSRYMRHYRGIQAKKQIATAIEVAVQTGQLNLEQALEYMEIFCKNRDPYTVIKPDGGFDNWMEGKPPPDKRAGPLRKPRKGRKSRKNRKSGKDRKEEDEDDDAEYQPDEDEEDDDDDDSGDDDDDDDDVEYDDEDEEDEASDDQAEGEKDKHQEEDDEGEYQRGGGEGDFNLNDAPDSNDENYADPGSPTPSTDLEDIMMRDATVDPPRRPRQGHASNSTSQPGAFTGGRGRDGQVRSFPGRRERLKNE